MRKWGWLIGILLGYSIPLAAQDIDAGPSTQRRSVVTIADQITDPAERLAFLDLFKQTSPAGMLSHATAFLERFPQSAFLAQAYEVAARASFDLQNYGVGLDHAARSLKLLPENPLLLVAVADVEARDHRNRAAVEHAGEALDDLERFAGPVSVQEEAWPEVRERLRASAQFSKGRALLQEALIPQNSAQRKSLVTQAEDALADAQHLNSSDVETIYTLGLAQLTAGQTEQAAASFTAAYRVGGELAEKALENLHSIHQVLSAKSKVSFEMFVAQADERWKSSQERSINNAGTQPQASHLPAYFGSESCRGCHADIYRQWSRSGMSKMVRPYAPQNVIGDFKINNQFYLGDEVNYRGAKIEFTRGHGRTLFARMVTHDGRHFFEISQSDGRWHSYPVDYTIGSKFQQAYATRLPNGEIHVFPIQYNALVKQWVNFWRVIDGPGSERADPRTWEKLDGTTSYQANCAVCHTSQLRNIKGGGFALNDVEFKEPGIDCEMCHGPSGQHVVERTANDYYPKVPLDPPVNFQAIESRKFLAICGQCHMQSAIRLPGPNGELNYSSTANFFGNHLRSPFGEFSRKGFYKDGRFRQTTFMVEALERSQCYKKAQLSCGTCHDPHGHDSATNPTSTKFRDQPDLMCVGCHSQFQNKIAAAQHSHHATESEGSRCVSCHMPRIMDALLFRARTHQIDDIPNAEMTQRFGNEESPNACLLCHTRQNPEWVQQQLSSWKNLHPERQRPTQAS